MRASVIIPTHNHAAILGRAVDSVLAQDEELELIVVDNASTDDTERVVESRASPRLRYVREERLGLHHARHAGARAATAPLLLFTDDDATAAPGWARAYVETFLAHPEVAAAGGPVRPLWEGEPPAWLERYVGGAKRFAPLALMEPFAELTIGRGAFFFGVNMAIRREVLYEHGGFRPELIGSRTIGSGEWGLLRALEAAGRTVAYVPGAAVQHHIPRARMSLAYLERWSWHGSAADMFERWHGRARRPAALARELARIGKSYWRTWLAAPRARHQLDPDSIRTVCRASAGRCELAYLWWMLTDREVRAALDAASYGP